MDLAHLANILLHIGSGTVAILIGFYLLVRPKAVQNTDAGAAVSAFLPQWWCSPPPLVYCCFVSCRCLPF